MRRRAESGPDVALGTVNRVRRVLERSGIPVSRNHILSALQRSGHATTRQRLNRALSFFFDLGLAVEGSKGIQWTHRKSASLRRAVAAGRQL